MPEPDRQLEAILELQRAAAPLEPDADTRRRLREAVVDYAEGFLERLPSARTFVADAAPARELGLRSPGEGPGDITELLDLLARGVDETGLKPSSPNHMAYIPGGGLYVSSLGDYLADITNEYVGIRFTGPGSVELENALLSWMADLVGYPADTAGNLTSGGSLANLIALVTAREAHGLRSADYPRAVVYLTAQAHHCLDKALRIAGMGECARRYVSMDERHRMDPAALERAVTDDARAGLRPWLVVASAGTTDVGAIDPLDAIADVADEHGVWYHVDGAYGGFFALCPEIRGRLRGIERSDSLVMDPHKSLFLPYGLGAVLVKDRASMQRAHAYRADYMQDAAAAEDALSDSPADLSPELTRPFRGLRLWLPLFVHGVAPFRACLQEKLELTRYFHRRVGEIGFETGPEPELTVATYRWLPERGDPDAFNEALVRALHEDGRLFVSSTRLDGAYVLRLAVLTFRTHLEHVERALGVLAEKVRELEAAGTG